jgi:hypothetical protein
LDLDEPVPVDLQVGGEPLGSHLIKRAPQSRQERFSLKTGQSKDQLSTIRNVSIPGQSQFRYSNQI